eukprot:TRINITY_DN5806_c1_g1_i2.p1 TRINITY_DN5806_c1_g1~~TRINITY_DN5806_c1_g1_i2.p1  ORF type:complete len:507 (-),score=122.23 TRINITY_DN5806_c1_g1_i2:69-1589(-)
MYQQNYDGSNNLYSKPQNFIPIGSSGKQSENCFLRESSTSVFSKSAPDIGYQVEDDLRRSGELRRSTEVGRTPERNSAEVQGYNVMYAMQNSMPCSPSITGAPSPDDDIMKNLMPYIKSQVDKTIGELAMQGQLNYGMMGYQGVSMMNYGIQQPSAMQEGKAFMNGYQQIPGFQPGFQYQQPQKSSNPNGFAFAPPKSVSGYPSYSNYVPPPSCLQNNEREQGLKKYREKRDRRKYNGEKSEERSIAAKGRSRNENGHFMPCKKPKTLKKDLENRLSNSESENQRLKDELSSQKKMMEELQRELERQRELNSRQSEAIQMMSNGQHESQFRYQQQYHEFRKRAEIQKQIDHEITERFKEINVQHQPAQHYYRGIPNQEFYPWNHHSIPAFSEKIDFSSINLKSTGPPSLVDIAKMESINGQRQWEQTRQNWQNSDNIMGEEPFLSEYMLPFDPLTPKMMPAFTEKIDLVSEKSRLKSVTSPPGSPMSEMDDILVDSPLSLDEQEFF